MVLFSSRKLLSVLLLLSHGTATSSDDVRHREEGANKYRRDGETESLIDTTSFLADDDKGRKVINKQDNKLEVDDYIRQQNSYNKLYLLDDDSFLSRRVISPLVVKIDKNFNNKNLNKKNMKTGERLTTHHVREENDNILRLNNVEKEESIIFDQSMTALAEYRYDDAIGLLESLVLQSPNNSNYHFNLGVAFQDAGDLMKAYKHYEISFTINPEERRALINFAVIVQGMGDFNLAISIYQRILALPSVSVRNNVEISFYCMVSINLGCSYFQASRTREASDVFQGLSSLLQDLMKLNCLGDEISNINRPGNELLRSTCLEMQQNFDQAVNYLTNIAHSLAVFKDREGNIAYLLRRTLLGTDIKSEVLRSIPETAVDPATSLLFSEVREGAGPLLPFDSLINDVSLRHRLHIAQASSNQLLASLPVRDKSQATLERGARSDKIVKKKNKLKIGFITCDFNDHPTAHMVEGIFALVREFRHRLSSRRQRGTSSQSLSAPLGGGGALSDIEMIAFSYGVSVESVVRQKIKQLSDRFIDLSQMSNSAASDVISREDIDILLDMQIHTLGHRLEITAQQPAPIQINYLVYPGTSGASFLQYIVTDLVVTPAEHAPHYSEAFLMLPSTYQISYYDRYERKISSFQHTLLENVNKAILTDRMMILCNFNKIDKFDFDSFAIWGQIMNRFPASIFRLVMDTREEVVATIRSEFNFRGVHSSRIEFLGRLDKDEHIMRHLEIDLFVDSLIYGAHSTATDALMGGLPVLTLTGDSFPQRVASSLLSSLENDDNDSEEGVRGNTDEEYSDIIKNKILQKYSFDLLAKVLKTFSKKSFEDVAVRLLSSPILLQKLRKLLLYASGSLQRDTARRHSKMGFFNTESLVEDFLRGMHAVSEIKHLTNLSKIKSNKQKSRMHHIFVTNN